MSTEFINDQWRLVNQENKSKQSNYSMNFDASSSDYIDVGSMSNIYDGTTSLTVSFWANLTDTGGYQFIFDSVDGGSSRIGFTIARRSNGNFIWLVNDDTNHMSTAYTVDIGFTLNNWHHVVLVYDKTNSNYYYYRDGIQYSVTPTISTNSNTSFYSLKIGRPSITNSYYTDGKIDAVSIYNYALSSSQVTTLYGSSSTGIGNPMSLSPKPVAYYPLGDQDAFNGANYLVPNSSLKDYVFDFGGSTNEKITTSNSSLINGESAASFSLWIKGKTGLASYDGMLCFRDGNNDYILIIVRGTITSTEFPVWIQQSSGGVATYTSNAIVSLNEWNHIVVSGAVGGKWNIYVNGELSTTQSQATNNIGGISQALSFTIGQDITGREFVGEMSNVQIFNTELPATGSNSVETLYNNGSPLTSMSGFTSLVSWWKLDASDTYDGTNWTIEDHAGSNDGTSSLMTQANLVQSDLSFTSGYSPYALDFDGTNPVISIPYNSSSGLNLLSNFSVSIWINIDTASFRNGAIGNVNNVGGFAIELRGTLSTPLIRFFIYDSVGIKEATAELSLVQNGWHHIVGTFDGTTLKIYTDSVKGTDATAASNMVLSTSYLAIGGYPIGYYFDGKLSNASYWNTALNQTQITEIYNEGVPSNLNNHSAYSNLVSWWQLGSNSSYTNKWICLDEKGTNNGASSGITEADIVDGVGSYANGTSSGMGGDEVIGDAPYSSSNSLSVNMDVEDRVTDTPS